VVRRVQNIVSLARGDHRLPNSGRLVVPQKLESLWSISSAADLVITIFTCHEAVKGLWRKS